MQTDIHALSVIALGPEDSQSSQATS
jgi:hypothetical protein